MSTNLANLKNISEKDRKQIEAAQDMLGPDPSTMGPVKNYFWGNFKESALFPYPVGDAAETKRCDELLAKLDAYLRTEHPAILIDQQQSIPEWVIRRLFDLGVLGMTIGKEYGGGGFGITAYNRALQRIGESCGSTAVLVSAHQSIGCKALMLFGNDEQKKRYLPQMAKEWLSAFCLSEPNVGCDAGSQETRCQLSECGEFYILNGEKKWATSAALSGLLTVMAKQRIKDPKTGKEKDGVTALMCTPDMDGVDIFSRNRSKCGIRGTWQARIRFTNVRVPRANLLHKEGRGLQVALTCLNFGRCTLSAGMVGGAKTAFRQMGKWAKYRYQFDRPIGEFDLIKQKLSRSAGYLYAMESMLYMTTGYLDRDDEDIMLETALCKVFCSEMGFRLVDDAIETMGGESYMTENHVERIWRDSRINIIVEGTNEVMHSFIFAYGSKQLGEWMLALKANPLKAPIKAMAIGCELFLGVRRAVPQHTVTDPRLKPFMDEAMLRIRDHGHFVKQMFKLHEESLVTNEFIQYRLSMVAVWIHAMLCSLSRLQLDLDSTLPEAEKSYRLGVVRTFCLFANEQIEAETRALFNNHDKAARACGESVMSWIDSIPNADFSIPERTPVVAVRGSGRVMDQTGIPQFGSGSSFHEVPRATTSAAAASVGSASPTPAVTSAPAACRQL
ncbi:MAG: acyl-CoA dehydrogenase family protein [Planctomycetota bacterium]|nr:acyl-CoA dehydrogenase family protein [Planctomycetota bacterium]MDA1105446.1 acyl-CoA dehydrogenase family protein [Planctomycetota bacterium]